MLKHRIKGLLLGIFILACGNQLYGIDIGAKFGLGLVNLRYSENTDIKFSPRLEYSAGIFVSFNIFKNLFAHMSLPTFEAVSDCVKPLKLFLPV